MSSKDRFMFISDDQKPFEAPGTLKFCLAVMREFKVPKENIYHVGDPFDQYHGGQWPKSPDAIYTPNSEIDETIARLRPWYRAFPLLKLANCNHGARWDKKARAAMIPSRLIRAYREVLGCPDGWEWKAKWDVNAKHPFSVIHGHKGFRGEFPHRQAALDFGRSIVTGHFHTKASIIHIKTAGLRLWAMATGCMIDYPDDESLVPEAFEYATEHRHKPIRGIGICIDGGWTPIFLPYERGF